MAPSDGTMTVHVAMEISSKERRGFWSVLNYGWSVPTKTLFMDYARDRPSLKGFLSSKALFRNGRLIQCLVARRVVKRVALPRTLYSTRTPRVAPPG